MLLRHSLSKLKGQMVWFFERTEDQSEFVARPGILLEHHKQKMLCDILFNNNVVVIADTDVMPMELWDEDLERKNGSLEIPGKRPRKHDRNSLK